MERKIFFQRNRIQMSSGRRKVGEKLGQNVAKRKAKSLNHLHLANDRIAYVAGQHMNEEHEKFVKTNVREMARREDEKRIVFTF